MVEPAFWRQFASISATMIGLVFLGTFYYLESGWKSFDFFQTRMEELSINYAKLIIAYFSVTLVLSLVQNGLFPPRLQTISYLVTSLAVIVTTRSLNKQLEWFESLNNENHFIWYRGFNWIWFAIVFVLPIIFVDWGFSMPEFTLNGLLIEDEAIGWVVFGSLIFGYWTLILFLLTPFQVHKAERDKKLQENKQASLEGDSADYDSWEDDRVRLAEKNIEEELEENGLSVPSDLNIEESFKTGTTLSGDLANPRLLSKPDVDENGEASIHLLISDSWDTNTDLLDRTCILAHLVGFAARKGYRDLTGIAVNIHQRYLNPYNDVESPRLLLKVRWTGRDLGCLSTKESEAEAILDSATHYQLNPVFYPLGLGEYDFDPSDREPSEDEKFTYYQVQDKSHATAKRTEAIVVFQNGMSQDEIRSLIPEILDEVRNMDCHRNQESAKKWNGKRADVVWLFLFDESRKLSDMVGIDANDHYLGKVEWFSPELDPDHAPLEMRDPDEVLDEARIKWSS